MARKKQNARQGSLFKREIPEMPEGYYSSGPNPNLDRFVEKQAKPYDLETDDYDVRPFDKAITSTKATTIYNMHTYWSKKPHGAIRQYIRHYTQPGDLVLDPFSGSGGTALSALIEDRKAIAIDLSPAATFITKNYCSLVDIAELQKDFLLLQEEIGPELSWLYETRCDRCDGQATTSNTVYSQVFQCPRCLEKIPLFDCIETQLAGRSGKTKKAKVCPFCISNNHLEEIKTSGERFGSIPVLVNYVCAEGCTPKRSSRHYNDDDPKKREYFKLYDLGKIEEIKSKEIPYWYPDAELSEVIPYRMLFKQDFRPEEASRLVDLFTKRNLWALSVVFNGIRSLPLENRDTLLFVTTSFLLNLTKLYRYRKSGGGQPTGNYYIPQINRENEAWSAFKRKFDQISFGRVNWV